MPANVELWTLLLSGGNAVLLIGIIWRTAAWKTDVDSQIKQHAERLLQLGTAGMHPDADRRISMLEQEVRMRDRENHTMNDGVVKRLERIEAKLDRNQQE